MADFVAGTWRQTTSDEIRFTVAKYGNDWRFDVRQWYRPKGEDEWRPTKKGISLKAGDLPAFFDAFRNAVDFLKSNNAGEDDLTAEAEMEIGELVDLLAEL